MVNARGEDGQEDVPRPPDEPDNTVNLDHVKTQQAIVRRKITRTCNAVDRIIVERGSRGGARALLQAAVDLLAAAEQLNNLLVGEADYERHHNDHLRYTALLGEVTERLDEYLAVRADDADSVASSHGSEWRRQEAQAQARRHCSRRSGSHRASHRATRRCHPRRTSSFSDPVDPAAPDDWINMYHDGLLPVTRRPSSRSAVKADLEVFSGRALDWFEWIDLTLGTTRNSRSGRSARCPGYRRPPPSGVAL